MLQAIPTSAITDRALLIEQEIATVSPAAVDDSSTIDTSKAISVLLKEGTTASHSLAHDSDGAALLAEGKLAKSEYINFLFMLWHVYDELERGLYEHREHPIIFHIYNPRVFSRATPLSFDICHLLGTVTWQTDPIYVDFADTMSPHVKAYTDRLSFLGRPEATDAEISLLAAHAYVRYLGDLSGGQFIRRKVVKAYELYDDGDGVWFYNFRTLDPRTGDRPSDNGEIKKIKEWFRMGIDEAVTDPATKIALVEEAKAGFTYNIALFSAIAAKPITSSSSLLSLLTSKSSSEQGLADSKSSSSSSSSSSGFPLGTIVALILAACIGHFALTVGGFTGESGGYKLAALLDKIRGNEMVAQLMAKGSDYVNAKASTE